MRGRLFIDSGECNHKYMYIYVSWVQIQPVALWFTDYSFPPLKAVTVFSIFSTMHIYNPSEVSCLNFHTSPIASWLHDCPSFHLPRLQMTVYWVFHSFLLWIRFPQLICLWPWGHFIPLSPAVPGLILLTGNNSEGNEANQAHWPIIRLSEAVDLGSAVSPHRSRTLSKIMPQHTRPTDPEL